MNKENYIGLERLANVVIENTGIHRDYSNEDLGNASIILMEVLMAKMFDKHKDKLKQEEFNLLAEEIGKNLRQTLLLATGVDMGKVFKQK